MRTKQRYTGLYKYEINIEIFVNTVEQAQALQVPVYTEFAYLQCTRIVVPRKACTWLHRKQKYLVGLTTSEITCKDQCTDNTRTTVRVVLYSLNTKSQRWRGCPKMQRIVLIYTVTYAVYLYSTGTVYVVECIVQVPVQYEQFPVFF